MYGVICDTLLDTRCVWKPGYPLSKMYTKTRCKFLCPVLNLQ